MPAFAAPRRLSRSARVQSGADTALSGTRNAIFKAVPQRIGTESASLSRVPETSVGWRSPPIFAAALKDLTPCRQAFPFSDMTCEAHAAASGRLIVVVVIGIRPASSGRERTGCPPTIPVANGFACPGPS